MRTAIHWLCRVFLALRDDDQREDAEDWLNGRDAVLAARVHRRNLDAVTLAGGEIG